MNKEDLIAGLATLCSTEKLLLQLKYLEELNDDEISAVLSIPVYDIGMMISAAKTKIRSFTDVFDKIDQSGVRGLNIKQKGSCL